MKESYAEYLLKKTKNDYDLILDKFSDTRKFVWEDLLPLFDYVNRGDKVLDLGCGNGRLSKIFKKKNANYIGVDNVRGLIEEAKKLFPENDFKVADVLDLPFSENSFDKVYSIAVLHHIPSKKFRIKFFKEAKRVLKPGGILILTTWNLWNMKKKRNLIFKHALLKIAGKSKLDFKDVLLAWKNNEGKKVTERYIHFFTQRDLRKLAKKSGFKVKKTGNLKKKYNTYLIAQKPAEN